MEKISNADDETKEIILQNINLLEKTISAYYQLLPNIFLRRSNTTEDLPSIITKQVIEESIKGGPDATWKLLRAAGIDSQDMRVALSPVDNSARDTKRDSIENQLNERISDGFTRFYSNDDYRINFRFNGDTLKVNVHTDKKVLQLDERSNGFRWYLNLFIDMLASEAPLTNTVFLLDEPGVYLHVNAQAQLRELFHDLASRGNQVIYTTHSPYMLDPNELGRIRVTEKNSVGDTLIHQSVYSNEIDGASKLDTLSPVFHAMGNGLKYSIGPSSKDNLIVEGVTDKAIIETMLSYLKVCKKDWPNIIPAIGADNIPHVASILIGWGCDFRILFDYDTKGFTVSSKIIKKLGIEINEKIVFVVDEPPPSNPNDKKVNQRTIESLICKLDQKKLGTVLDKTEESKSLFANEFRKKVMSKELKPEKETCENFNSLFKRIISKNKEEK